ncbi:hypothetical protein [Streptomyces sp. NPDC057545]|uniref:hypothetical protein n=1 Tax=Streptomyces sp. NPDC057545 TaxID=3346164 RepID=UPI0036958C7C
MTDYSAGEHVDSSINVHIVPRLGSRKHGATKYGYLLRGPAATSPRAWSGAG